MIEDSNEDVQQEKLYEARHARFLAKEEERKQGLQMIIDKANRRMITRYRGVTPNKYDGFGAMVENDVLDAEINMPQVDWDALEDACVDTIVKDGNLVDKVDWPKMLKMIRKAKSENGGPRLNLTEYDVLEFIEDATMSQDGWRAKQIENMSSVGQPQSHRQSWLSALFGARKKP